MPGEILDSVDPKEAASAAADRFPFVMVLTTTFLLGGMFLLINAPLLAITIGLVKIAEHCEFRSAIKIASCGLAPFWGSVLTSGEGLSLGFLFLVLSVLAGVLITPIDRLSTLIFARIWSIGRRAISGKTRSAPPVAFTSALFSAPNFPAFLDALMRNRIAKLHWEWELFHYYVYWGVVTNAFIAIVLVVYLQSPRASMLELSIYAMVFFHFLGFAALHSEVMTRVHEHYRRFLPEHSAAAQPGGQRDAAR